MKIKEIRHRAAPLQSSIRNAMIDFSQMTVSTVAIITDVLREGKPVIGYGFNSNGRYAPEGILADRIIPRLMAAKAEDLLTDEGDNFDPFKARQIMMKNEKPGGHGERSVAVGVIDMALWDLVAKIEGKPLYRVLGERFNGGRIDEKVAIYAAGGYYYPGQGLQQLKDEMKSYLDQGYTSVKMKIGGASLEEDRRRIEAVLEVVGRREDLAVDANGRFGLHEAIAYSEVIDEYGLRWFEEVGDPLDFLLNATISSVSQTPIATGENLFSMVDARNLLRYGGMNPNRDWLQFDPALSYGLVEFLQTLEMMKNYGWSPRRCIPHGGHQFALHIAAGLQLGGNESYPLVFQPYGGFGDTIAIENGLITPPQVPGIGFELKSELMKTFVTLGL